MSNPGRGRFAAFAETFSHVCTPIAIIIALVQFGCAAQGQLEQRRFEIYNQINDQYLQFLELCVRHDWVDCFDLPNATLIERYDRAGAQPPRPDGPKPAADAQPRRPGDLEPTPRSAREAKTEGAAFAALISLLERSYVFYKKTLAGTDPMAKRQWSGWEKYARSFAQRERFRLSWADLREEFDEGFMKWMDDLISETTAPRAK